MPRRWTGPQRRAYEDLRLLIVKCVREYEIPQRHFARAAGIKQQMVSQVLKGAKGTSAEGLLRIALAVSGWPMKPSERQSLVTEIERTRDVLFNRGK